MNRPVDYRTDCYSMGVLLYRMLTGQLPFQANDPLEWTHCHIARMPTPPSEIAPEVPRPVSDIVMKLLAKLPEDRYQSPHGLQADLDRTLAQWQAYCQIEPVALGASVHGRPGAEGAVGCGGAAQVGVDHRRGGAGPGAADEGRAHPLPDRLTAIGDSVDGRGPSAGGVPGRPAVVRRVPTDVVR